MSIERLKYLLTQGLSNDPMLLAEARDIVDALEVKRVYLLVEHREIPDFSNGRRRGPIHRPVYASKEHGKVYEKFCSLPSDVARGQFHWHEIVTLEVDD